MRRWLCMGVGIVAVAGQAMAAPVGMASHISGKPEVSTGGTWKPLALLQRLEAGSKVRCSAGAGAVIVLFGNGNRYQVAAGKVGTVQESNVAGATPLGGLSGPSSRVAKALGGSRAGAMMARGLGINKSLKKGSPGWVLEGSKFEWDAVPDATTYAFTLYDQMNAPVWSNRANETAVEYPADLPALKLRTPYLWTLVPMGATGKPVAGMGWGVITLLNQEDADQLKDADQLTAGTGLDAEVAKNQGDLTPIVMLAEQYRQYGVLEKTLEIYEALNLAQPKVADKALDDTFWQVNSYAYALSHPRPANDTGTNG